MTLTLTGWNLLLFPVALQGLALFWGAPIVALACELGAIVSGRPLLLRLAQQLSGIACVIHPALWIATGAILWVAASPNPSPEDALPWTTLIVAAAGSCLTLAWGLTWSVARSRRGLHLALGIGANLCLKYGYWGAALLVAAAEPETIPWALASLWPLTALFLTATCGPLYLILRRSVDDWGRDYYRYAARTLGRWVLGTFLLPVFALGWIWSSYHRVANLFLPQLTLPSLLAAGLLLFAAILGGILARAEHPMRHKVLMVGLALTGILAGMGLFWALAEGLTHYVPGWTITTPVPYLLERLGIL